MQGRSGDRIDKFGLICGQVGNTSNQITIAAFGGTGGVAFFDVCGAGGFLSGTAGRTGAEVDQLQGLCRSQ